MVTTNTLMALLALLGGLLGLGMVLVALGLGNHPVPQLHLTRRLTRPHHQRLLQLAVAVGAALAVGLATGWVVGAFLAGLGVLTLPRMLGPDRAHQAAIARAEATAGWAEMLRDTLAGAAGIEQAIIASAPVAPEPIRPQVTALAAALRQQRLPAALTTFAGELADPTGDLVVAALLHASQHQAGRLGDQLGALAAVARSEVTMRLRVAVARARVRTSVRVIITTTLTMAGGLALTSRAFLAPYDSAVGQLALALIGVVFAAGLRWLERMSRLPTPRRVLAPPSSPAEEVSA